MNKERQTDDQLTVAHFLRLAAAEKVASVLHEEVSETPQVVRGRKSSMVAQLAKQLGVTRPQFESRAAEIVAAQAFGFKYDPDKLMQDIMNGTVQVIGGNKPQKREASKSGQHQINANSSVSTGRTQRRTA